MEPKWQTQPYKLKIGFFLSVLAKSQPVASPQSPRGPERYFVKSSPDTLNFRLIVILVIYNMSE